ncbi:MAG TPA: DUF2235 domain-containing protein [Candidatus Angelobacter sp.]
MSKNIVICCDGTGNEFGGRNSNVIKLYQTLKCDATQIAYYHPGVGTMGSRSALSSIGKGWTRVIGLAFGYGISDNIADAYQFLMRNYEPGDKVYIFGFSRGAFTARALCGMLFSVGLLTPGNEGLVPYAIRLMKRVVKESSANPVEPGQNFPLADDFKKTFSRPSCDACVGWCPHQCRPYFVGLWDTVSSVGWVYNAVRFPFTNANSNPHYYLVRHAMSIDERRSFFRQNSFREAFDGRKQDIQEVWFAGVHSDVGGSYPEPQSQLSKISLRWMLDEAENAKLPDGAGAKLQIDADRKAAILGGKPPEVAPDATTPNQHNSLRGVWWIAEVWPKIGHKKVGNKWKKTLRFNLGRRRWIPPDPCVHASVDQRINWVPSAPVVPASAKGLVRKPFPYKPSNVPEQHRTVGGPGGLQMAAKK